MANCKRCDRCGLCYDKLDNGSSLLNIQIFSISNETYDLCVECTKKLTTWLNEFKKESQNDGN